MHGYILNTGSGDGKVRQVDTSQHEIGKNGDLPCEQASGACKMHDISPNSCADARQWLFKWLVELLDLFYPARRVILLVAAGNSSGPVGRNHSEIFCGFSVTAPDPQIQSR